MKDVTSHAACAVILLTQDECNDIVRYMKDQYILGYMLL